MSQNEKVGQILIEKLKKQGTVTDALQLMVFAKEAKLKTSSKEQRESALRSLKTYVPNKDPFE